MHLLRSVVVSLLAGAGLALPGGSDGHALKQARDSGYSVKKSPLTTRWTDKVGKDPWPEYPRPQLQRSKWHNLNGVWQYRNASGLDAVDSPPFGKNLDKEVLVPSCLESGLSGMLNWSCWSNELVPDRSYRNPRDKYPVLVVLNHIQSAVWLEGQRPAELWSRRLRGHRFCQWLQGRFPSWRLLPLLARCDQVPQV